MSGYLPRVELEPTGLDIGLGEMERAVQGNVRRFAEKVLRPVGQQLDKLTPEQVIAADSPLWRVFAEFAELGLNLTDIFALEPEEQASMMSLVFEELGWGDGGLAVSLGAAMLPAMVMHMLGRHDLLERYADRPLGCWGITEPDHGSDMLDASGHTRHPGASVGRLNCHARF
ncbi:TPA: acyl-CoA/acyl-ACP dehydrogenase, partial [Pseudomonas aeruginosa]|nr:acyl-CoA/acyl-ACP dehydrogenase [Pseudomonas aeruginosa]